MTAQRPAPRRHRTPPAGLVALTNRRSTGQRCGVRAHGGRITAWLQSRTSTSYRKATFTRSRSNKLCRGSFRRKATGGERRAARLEAIACNVDGQPNGRCDRMHAPTTVVDIAMAAIRGLFRTQGTTSRSRLSAVELSPFAQLLRHPDEGARRGCIKRRRRSDQQGPVCRHQLCRRFSTRARSSWRAASRS